MSIDEEYGFTTEDIEAYVLEKVASKELDVKDIHSFNKKIETAAKQGYTNREGYEPKPYPTEELGMAAYAYILDNGGSPDEALEHSRVEQNIPVEIFKEMKNRNTYKKHSKSIVEKHEDHPVQKQMIENQVFDKTYMGGLNRINQLIRKLVECKTVNDRIETLEEITKIQQQEIERVSVESAYTKVKIDHIEEVNMLKTMKPKDVARELWKRGCKQQYVAFATGRSLTTIKRWWKDFKYEVS